MGIFDFWTGSHSNPQVRTSLSRKDLETLIAKTEEKVCYKNYAIQLCINKLASALSLCRFETFDQGQPKKDHYWWKFNYEPNINMNMHDFLYQLIYEMVYNDEGALVIQNDTGDLVVASSYTVNEGSYLGNLYSNIELHGGLKLERSYREEDVLRFQLPNKEVRKLIDNLYSDYGRLIGMTTDAYIRDHSLKLVLEIGTMFNQQPIQLEDGTEIDPVEEIMTSRFKNLFSGGNTVTPLEQGLTLQELGGSRRSGEKVKASEINDLMNKSIDFVADAFGIPRGLLKGDVADVEAMTDNFITFAIRPLAKELETEINRKLYRKEKVLIGTRLKVVTGSIQTYNIVSFAAAADKIIAASIGTPNEMRELLEWERVDNPELDKFKETKNYQELGTVET